MLKQRAHRKPVSGPEVETSFYSEFAFVDPDLANVTGYFGGDVNIKGQEVARPHEAPPR